MFTISCVICLTLENSCWECWVGYWCVLKSYVWNWPVIPQTQTDKVYYNRSCISISLYETVLCLYTQTNYVYYISHFYISLYESNQCFHTHKQIKSITPCPQISACMKMTCVSTHTNRQCLLQQIIHISLYETVLSPHTNRLSLLHKLLLYQPLWNWPMILQTHTDQVYDNKPSNISL